MKYEVCYQKFTFINTTFFCLQSVFKSWDSIKHRMIDAVFPTILILTWKLYFYCLQQIPLVTAQFLHVKEKCQPKTQAWMTMICQSFFPVNMMFHEEGGLL